MHTAQEFNQQIDSLGIDGMQVSLSTANEAKEMLHKLRIAEKTLRAIKQSINAQQRTIRSQYQDKKANAGTGGSTILQLFGKKGAAGSYRAAAKRGVHSERDRVLEPYDKVKARADILLNQIATVKSQLDIYLLRAKTEPSPSSLQSSKSECAKCGKKISGRDKYCSGCGMALS